MVNDSRIAEESQPLDSSVGFYRNAWDNKGNSYSALTILANIKSGHWLEHVEYARRIHDEQGHDSDEYRTAKAQLPAVTWAGTFKPTRSKSNLETSSGFLVVDLDNLENAPEVRDRAAELPSTVAAYISPSGVGVKVVVAIFPTPNPDDHVHAWRKAKWVYGNHTGAAVDESGKDCSRLCFISADQDIYINDNPEPLGWEVPPPEPKREPVRRDAPGLPEDEHGIDVDALHYVDPPDNYDEWLGWLITLKSLDFTVSEAEAWCALGSKYSPGEAEQRWDGLPGNPDEDARNKLRGHAYNLGWRKRVAQPQQSQRRDFPHPADDPEFLEAMGDAAPPGRVIPTDQTIASLVGDDLDAAIGEYALPLTPQDKEEGLRTTAAILTRNDGTPVIYGDGRYSSVYGEPGSGKSWVALMAIREGVSKGGRYLYMDFEDTRGALAERATQLRVFDALTDKNVFRYASAWFDRRNGAHRLAPEELEGFVREMVANEAVKKWLLSAPNPRMSAVVIDTTISSGLDQEELDTTEWHSNHIDPLRNAGIAVITLDHVPKSRKDRPIGAIGATTKLGKLSGAGILAEATPTVWTRRKGGAITLRLQKDRLGEIDAHQGAFTGKDRQNVIAIITGDYIDGAFGYKIEPDIENIELDYNPQYIPVLVVLRSAGEAGVGSINNLFARLGMAKTKERNTNIGVLLEQMQLEGLIVKTKQGKGTQINITRSGGDYLDTHGTGEAGVSPVTELVTGDRSSTPPSGGGSVTTPPTGDRCPECGEEGLVRDLDGTIICPECESSG